MKTDSKSATKKLFIETYGCQMNVADTEVVAAIMQTVGYEITEDMYDALKPLSDSNFMSKTIKPLNVASNFHRGLLTEYNPVFIITNGIKDIQDVLINSQHPARTYAKIPEAFAQLTKKGYFSRLI